MGDQGPLPVDDDRLSICRFLLRAGSEHPAAPAVITDREPLTYGELLARARTVAALLSPDVRKNPRIALLADNGPTYVVLYWGILLAGGVTVELNPGLGRRLLGARWSRRRPDSPGSSAPLPARRDGRSRRRSLAGGRNFRRPVCS